MKKGLLGFFIALGVVALSVEVKAAEFPAPWQCPTADGPVAIAEAQVLGGDVVYVAEEVHGCSTFPSPIGVTPVEFVVRVEDGDGGAYVWKVRPEEGSDFYLSYTGDVHKLLLAALRGI